MFTSASTMAPKKAAKKPCTAKPGTKAEANQSISALMTHQKIPSVTMVSGKVRIFNTSPRVAFTSPMTTAAIRAVKNPSITNPGMR